MVYEIEFHDRAEKEFAKLDGSVKKDIFDFIERLKKEENPRFNGKYLKGDLKELWRYRVGDYRILAVIEDKILVLDISHRSKVYEKSNTQGLLNAYKNALFKLKEIEATTTPKWYFFDEITGKITLYAEKEFLQIKDCNIRNSCLLIEKALPQHKKALQKVLNECDDKNSKT